MLACLWSRELIYTRGSLIIPTAIIFRGSPSQPPVSTLSRIRETGQTGWRRDFVDGDGGGWSRCPDRASLRGLRQDPQFYPEQSKDFKEGL